MVPSERFNSAAVGTEVELDVVVVVVVEEEVGEELEEDFGEAVLLMGDVFILPCVFGAY